MEFRDWVELEEIFCDYLEVARDTSSLPVDNIDMNAFIDGKGKKNYVSKFTIGEDSYKVEIRPIEQSFAGKNLEGIFDISFHGPAGYLTTNKNNTGVAKNVYQHLLASVAKMKEVQEGVNGFSFIAAEPKMALLYKKFYKDYMLPAGYLRVNYQLYLNKSYIRQILSALPDSDKRKVLGQIASDNREANFDINRAKKIKNKERSATIFLKGMVNKIIVCNYQGKDTAGFIVGVGLPVTFDNYAKVFLLYNTAGGRRLGLNDVMYTSIITNIAREGNPPKFELIKAPTKSQIEEVVKAIEDIKTIGVSIPLPSPMASARGISHPTNAAAYSRNFEEVLKTYKPSGPFSTWLQNEPSKSLEVVA